MERKRLVAARVRRHWTLAQAAEHLLVDINTLSRWERGKATPRAYNLQQLCDVYEVTASELDIEDDHSIDMQSIPVKDISGDAIGDILKVLVEQDLTLHFIKVILSWPHRNTQYHELQAQIKQATEEFCAMNNSFEETMTRRDALRRLALTPLTLYSLFSAHTIPTHSIGDILTQCAAGITACEYLSNHADLAVAFSAISAYVPMLTEVIKTSSQHRQAAAHLVTQCLFLKTILSTHLEDSSHAMRYAQQAVDYSKESGDLPLHITALGRQAWVYSCEKQQKHALENALEALFLLKQSHSPLPSSVQSYVYGVLAKYQAFNGLKSNASTSLQQAHDAFFTNVQKEESSLYAYMDHDLSNFLLDEGVTRLFMVQYEEALESFAKIIDPNDLSPRIPMAERIRIEILNYQTVASLKSSNKDMQQTMLTWQTAIQGARTLRSEQRFAEACTAFEMMECVWPREKAIDNLRELTLHW